MKITKIHIDSFGGIKDKTIELDNGINLINGENGSGKTLIAAFILFIFYGFSDRNEKKLRSDISSGVSLGCADIVTDNGEAFTIHRKELASGRSEVRVVTPTGESFDGWRAVGEPGDFFLGMNAQTFARSAFISHTDGAVIHGDPTEAARNLLSSGSESADTRKALERLDEMKTELLHKNGKGGKLFELSKQAAEIEKKLILSAESTQRASVAKAEIEHTESQLLNLERKQAEARNILISKRRQELKNRLNELSSLNDEKKRLSGEVLRINHGGISRKELKNANSTKASRIPFSFIAILLASLSVICGIMPFTPFSAGFTALFPLCAVLFSSSLVLFCIAGMSKTRAKHSLISTINDRIARIELRIAELRGQLTAFSASEIEEASRDTISPKTDAILDTAEPIEALELAHSETMAKLNDMKLRYASDYSSDSNTETLHSELDSLKNEISALKLRYDALELAHSTLKKADDTLKRDVLPRLSARAGELFSLFTEQKYNGIGMESDERGLRLTYRDKSGFSDAIYLSHGSGELAWLCIRLAIWELSGDHRIPLILDECFAFYDDRRMCATLSHLLSLSENGAQIFVFSANGRELSVLRNNCHFISI